MILRPELAAVLGSERFLAEIKTTAALRHPHILPLHDSGEADGYLYYVMPYIDGETLREKLDREKRLGVEEAVRIARDVADALDYAHRAGVIHRDIKPGNRRATRWPSRGGRLRNRPGSECRGRRADDRDGALPRHAALHESRAGV